VVFQDKDGQIVLDRLRTVDKARLVKRLGQIEVETQQPVWAVLAEMFAE
jgi:mRNA interferase MazF